MDMHDQIEQAYMKARNYPDLVKRLIDLGIRSYTVETSTGTILYRRANGEHILHPGPYLPREVSATFSKEATIEAIRDNQEGRTDYPGFMNAIGKAGVKFYEATLEGDKRVTYIGSGGYYEEKIPV